MPDLLNGLRERYSFHMRWVGWGWSEVLTAQDEVRRQMAMNAILGHTNAANETLQKIWRLEEVAA